MTDEIDDALEAVQDAVDDATDAIEDAAHETRLQGLEGRLAALEDKPEHSHEHTHAELAASAHDHEHSHDEYAPTAHEHEQVQAENSGEEFHQESTTETVPDRGEPPEREKIPRRTHPFFKRVRDVRR